jgi:hypothetical protein
VYLVQSRTLFVLNLRRQGGRKHLKSINVAHVDIYLLKVSFPSSDPTPFLHNSELQYSNVPILIEHPGHVCANEVAQHTVSPGGHPALHFGTPVGWFGCQLSAVLKLTGQKRRVSVESKITRQAFHTAAYVYICAAPSTCDRMASSKRQADRVLHRVAPFNLL